MRAVRTFISYISNNLQLNSRLNAKVRQQYDNILEPICHKLQQAHISPNLLTALSILTGICSMGLIFMNYWYFIAGMLISLLFDMIDGPLARYQGQDDKRSSLLKFLGKHWFMLGLSIVFSIYLHHAIWMIIPAAFSLLCYINFKLGEPLTIPCGKNLLFIPALIGLPEASFAIVALYSIAFCIMLARNLFYPLQNAPLAGYSACPQRARVVHLS